MTDERLPTELWVMAHVRQCGSAGIPVYVARKGAYASGTVMVKLVTKAGVRVLSQSRDLDGNPGWMNVFDEGLVEERRADDYLARAAARDPDIWVVEVESGENPFGGRVF